MEYLGHKYHQYNYIYNLGRLRKSRGPGACLA